MSLQEAEKVKRVVVAAAESVVWTWTVPELESREIEEWARMWKDGTSAEETKSGRKGKEVTNRRK